MPLLTLYLVAGALHGYIAARLLPHLPVPGAWALGALLAASAIVMPLGLVGRRVLRPGLANAVAAIGLFAMGLFSSLLVGTFLRDLVLLAAGVIESLHATWTVWPWLEPATAKAVPLLAIAVTLLGLWNARRTAGVVTVEVPVANLPAALHGFTIAQISDIHVGPTIRRRYIESIVDAVNRLGADAVAINGDLVDGSVPELADHVAPLAKLAAREGTFFVTGNHEYYSGAGPWLAELQRLGIRNLINEHVVIERDGSQLVLAGVTDFSGGHFHESHRSDPQAALAGAPADAVKVLLAHQPRSAPAAARAGFDVQLSGHTHGGQFWPWNHFVRFQQPFTAGLHRLDELWVYVSRGTGYWGPPKRFGAPSEITLVKLRPAA